MNKAYFDRVELAKLRIIFDADRSRSQLDFVAAARAEGHGRNLAIRAWQIFRSESAGPRIVRYTDEPKPVEPLPRVAPVSVPRGKGDEKPVRIVDLVGAIRAEAALALISTGIQALDDVIGGGFMARALHLIIAATGRGKTSLAAQIAAWHGERSPVAYYCGEMTPAQLAGRVVAQRTGRCWSDIMRGQLSDGAMAAVLVPLAGMDVIKRCDEPIAALKRSADEMLARGRSVPLLVVDYIQLLADFGPDMRIATMCAVRALLALVESRDIVVLALAQGNRGSARRMRNDARGAAEDYVDVAAETKALEDSATTVITLVGTFAEGATVHDVTAMVGKRRMGGSGRAGLRFDGPSGLWGEGEGRAVAGLKIGRLQVAMGKILAEAAKADAPISRDELRVAIGMGKSIVNDAVDALLEDGRLVECESGARSHYSLLWTPEKRAARDAPH